MCAICRPHEGRCGDELVIRHAVVGRCCGYRRRPGAPEYDAAGIVEGLQVIDDEGRSGVASPTASSPLLLKASAPAPKSKVVAWSGLAGDEAGPVEDVSARAEGRRRRGMPSQRRPRYW
jgi:hypothetical protein